MRESVALEGRMRKAMVSVMDLRDYSPTLSLSPLFRSHLWMTLEHYRRTRLDRRLLQSLVLLTGPRKNNNMPRCIRSYLVPPSFLRPAPLTSTITTPSSPLATARLSTMMSEMSSELLPRGAPLRVSRMSTCELMISDEEMVRWCEQGPR